MTALRDIHTVIEEVGKVQRDRLRDGQQDDLTELLGQAYFWLQNLNRAATCAERAIEDALRDVPWIDHHGLGDPPLAYPDYVQVRFRDGETRFGARWDWDQNWQWLGSDKEHDGDIVAYRAMPASSPST